MRIAISSLAWDPTEDAGVASVMREQGVDAIELVPGKYSDVPGRLDMGRLEEVGKWWAQRNIEIVAFQSLFFGVEEAHLFRDAASQRAMVERFAELCKAAELVGARYLVFGSPRQRSRGPLLPSQATEMATVIFQEMGEIAQRYDCVLCLEPNPGIYGTDFMNDCKEVVDVVQRVNHPNVRMQFDAGAISINHEDPVGIMNDWGDLIGHFHLSEPDLVPFGKGTGNHAMLAGALDSVPSTTTGTLEMLPPSSATRIAVIAEALQFAMSTYGNDITR